MSSPYVNPIGQGLTLGRTDMGVDYSGKGPLYALGSGTITNVYNSGWPPYGPKAAFIELHLDQGPYAGKYVYYAENIIPTVHVGEQVKAGQLVGTAVGTYPYIEVGWGAGKGGETLAAATTGYTEGQVTAAGQSFKNFITSLGKGGQGTAASSDGSTSSSPTIPGCVPLIWLVYLVVMKLRKTKANRCRTKS
jgi:hypothetical protein